MRLRGMIAILAAAAGLLSAPAMADVRAVYADPGRKAATTTVEVADDGTVRITMPRGEAYVLLRDGQAYAVSAGPGGPTAITWDAIAFQHRQDIRDGTIIEAVSAGSSAKSKQTAPRAYAAGEAVSIGDYTGVRYALPGIEGPGFILTDAPGLKPLGEALSRYLAVIDRSSGDTEQDETNLSTLLATHGVLGFWAGDLTSISFAPIDPARFTLPVTPTTVADLEAKAAKRYPSETIAKEAVRAPVLKALYRNRTLLTLDGAGAIAAWPEGSDVATPIETPGRALAFCALGNELLVMTGNTKGEGEITLWSGHPGSWRTITKLKATKRDPFLALDCSGSEPLVMMATRLVLPQSGRALAIDPKALGATFGEFTTLQLGGYLYVGNNAGEWGGGLRRFALTDGSGSAVDASAPESLCGGTLNASCDPVTGLVPDPSHSGCVLASVGLVHFFSSGQIVRTCGQSIEPVYRKPYTLNADWETHPTEEDGHAYSSVPFFSIASTGNVAWAVGSDGLYRFGAEDRPEFTSFGGDRLMPPSGIDWSNPDFVQVMTDKNQRFSVSGNSLMLIPRDK